MRTPSPLLRRALLSLLLVTGSLLAPGCGSSGTKSEAPASEAQRYHLTLAKSGTLAPADGEGAYTLSLTGVPAAMLWFDDRPRRGSGAVATADFVARWDATYASFPPHVVVDTFYRGTEDEIGFYVKLERPAYSADTGELTFAATLLATTLDADPTTALAIDDAKLTFLDEATDGTTDHWSFVQGSQSALLTDNGDGTLNLALTGVPQTLYAVGNAPNARSFVDHTVDFVHRWSARFGDSPPNVVLTTYLEDDTVVALVLTLSNPVYDAGNATLSYRAVLLHGDDVTGKTLFVPTIIIDSAQATNVRTIDTRIDAKSSAARTLIFLNNTGADLYVGGQGSSAKKGADEVAKKIAKANNLMLGAFTGFKVADGETVDLLVYNDLQSGTFWARTGCAAKASSIDIPYPGADDPKYTVNYLACDTGVCTASAAWIGWAQDRGLDVSKDLLPEWCFGTGGEPARNMFEVSFRSDGVDFYDVTNIDGYAVPLSVKPTGTFHAPGGKTDKYECNGAVNQTATPVWAGCQGFDLTKDCPPELQVKKGENVVACLGLGKALGNNTQKPIVEKALKARGTDPLNADMIALFKTRYDMTLATLKDIFDATGAMRPEVQDLYECGCGTAGSACGLPNCNFGCTSATDGGKLYTNNLGKCIENKDWALYKDVTSDCVAANGNKGIIWNAALIANMKQSECNVDWWPKPDETFCKGKVACAYDRIFKDPCPDAYSWQFDDHNSTYVCNGADYHIVFGPPK